MEQGTADAEKMIRAVADAVLKDATPNDAYAHLSAAALADAVIHQYSGPLMYSSKFKGRTLKQRFYTYTDSNIR